MFFARLILGVGRQNCNLCRPVPLLRPIPAQECLPIGGGSARLSPTILTVLAASLTQKNYTLATPPWFRLLEPIIRQFGWLQPASRVAGCARCPWRLIHACLNCGIFQGLENWAQHCRGPSNIGQIRWKGGFPPEFRQRTVRPILTPTFRVGSLHKGAYGRSRRFPALPASPSSSPA